MPHSFPRVYECVGTGRNALAVPQILGDPFISFDADEEAGYLVTGSAVGAVCLWRLDHIAQVMLGAATEHADERTRSNQPNSTPIEWPAQAEVACRALSPSSDEGAKHVWLQDSQVFAVVGDVHVKVWGSWHDATSQLKRFERTHEYKSCKETYTLKGGSRIIVITVGGNEGVVLDLETMMQTPVRIPIPVQSTPMHYDGGHLLLMVLTASGTRLLQVWEVSTERLVRTLVFEKRHRQYWGFQLVPDRNANSQHNSADHGVTSASASSAPLTSQSTTSSSSSSSSTVPSTVPSSTTSASSSPSKCLVYLCCGSTIKFLPWSSLGAALTPQSALLEPPRPPPFLSTKIRTNKPQARVLAFTYDSDVGQLMTLSSDGNHAKIKVWAVDARAARQAGVTLTSEQEHASPFPGVLLSKYRHIAGSFKIGYPYVIKKIGSRLIFYTADEGIFILRM